MKNKRRLLLKFLTLFLIPFNLKFLLRYKKRGKQLNGWILKNTDN